MKKKVAVIGAGFSGLSAAAYLAKAGYDVHVFEKHTQPGGRARQFSTTEGFKFDMGPSWYWMPDIIESFFSDFGCSTADFFELVSLNPQFEMIFDSGQVRVPESYQQLKLLFEQIEPGAGMQLDRFMEAAKFKYEVGMRDFVNKPCHNWGEFLSPKIALSAFKLDLLSNFRSYVAKYFNDQRLRTLMEFPVIFLGASPKDIPALYSLMNYGGYALGTHYPKGGFFQLVLAMQQVAERQGVTFHFDHNVDTLKIEKNKITSLGVNGVDYAFDLVVASADYHHIETLLTKELRNYDEDYWKSRTFAPSSLIYYLGMKSSIPNLTHHTLFFEHPLDDHIDCIYGEKKWPQNPLFYVCCPSKTDPHVAPAGSENLFLLMPLATAISDDDETREKYLIKMLERLEKHTGTKNLYEQITYKRSYCVSDFISDYNAYAGNAYGLANTLKQTAVWKPKIRNKKVHNLFYSGQLTVPGPEYLHPSYRGKLLPKKPLNYIVKHKTMKKLFDELAYEVSKKTTEKYSTSFSLGILALKPSIRASIYAIYGYVRLADEIVDSFHGYDKQRLLARLYLETNCALEEGISLNPILQSFQETVHKYAIDIELIRQFLHSMEMDLNKVDYNSERYKEYIYGSAEVVGLMCLQVFTEGNRQRYEELKPYAMKLGSAFQKINFLRDLKDDYQVLGRTYFPNLDMAVFDNALKSQIEDEIHSEFKEALLGIKKLPASAKFGVYLAYKYYLSLFAKIRKKSSKEILESRIRIPNAQKAYVAFKSYLRYKAAYL